MMRVKAEEKSRQKEELDFVENPDPQIPLQIKHKNNEHQEMEQFYQETIEGEKKRTIIIIE